MFFLTDDAWEVRDTLTKGQGVFTRTEISPGIIVGDYLGKVLRLPDTDDIDDSKNFYLMYYSDQASIFPELSKPGIHLLNHSCTPNIWMYTYHGHTLFFALRRIFPGEELTVSYLLSPQKDCRNCSHFCICGSTICIGTMHMSEHRYEIWSKHHEDESEKTKPMRVRYGHTLPKLAQYPKSIPDDPTYILFGSAEKEAVRKNDATLPALSVLRKEIRESGRYIEFPKLRLQVLGVTEDILYAEKI